MMHSDQPDKLYRWVDVSEIHRLKNQSRRFKKIFGLTGLAGAGIGSGASVLAIRNSTTLQKQVGLYTKENAIELFCGSSRRRNAEKPKGGRRTRRR